MINVLLKNTRKISCSRSFSAKLEASRLVINKSSILKPLLPNDKLVFGRTFTDHMLSIDWNENSGWAAPTISKYENLSLSPASPCLHYAIECFEGMKAYKSTSGTLRLFRPDMNMARMNRSMTRLAMPALDGEEYLKCLKELIRLDERWIPTQKGFSLYIRPTCIGTEHALGVHESADVKHFTILSPVGPYYKSGVVPVRLLADEVNVRAWPGGVGNFKVGGNYAPTIDISKKATLKGYSQVLWLSGPAHEVTEVGAMNMFFYLKKKNSQQCELVTPPLSRGDILPGVTRDSVLQLAKDWNDFEVSERMITMEEIVECSNQGRLLEAFGAGTAAIISPVSAIGYQDKDINLPSGTKESGPIAARFRKSLEAIQHGEVEHPWSVVI